MSTITKRPAGRDHAVAVVPGAPHSYRREPCPGCPWRIDQTGVFPQEAFEHSANTAEPGSMHVFGCHESGIDKPSTCAGFLLRGAKDNGAVHVLIEQESIDLAQVHDGGLDLHPCYADMASANAKSSR